MRMRGIPGPRFWGKLPTGPVRGLWANETTAFAVGGGILYQIFPYPKPPVALGNVGNGTNPVTIASNSFQLCIASAGLLYTAASLVPGSVEQVFFSTQNVDGSFSPTAEPVRAATVTFQDQYFIAGIQNSKQVAISQLAPDGGIWDAADVADKEGYSDNINIAWVDKPGGEYLWLFGAETTEIWADTGSLFPFQRVSGMVFPIGADSAWSVAGAEGVRFWLWRGVVYMASGFQPSRCSDYGVEEAIKTYSLFDQQNCEGFAWIDGGHIFYALSFPEANATWVFDMATQSWHERLYCAKSTTSPVNATFSRYRPRVYAYAFGQHLVGDYENGNIYQLDPTYLYDAGLTNTTPAQPGIPLIRERIAPYLTENMNNTRFNRFTLDADTGIGLPVAVGNPGQQPNFYMRYSKDRGKTWSRYLQSSAGKVGETQRRVFWKQLGSSRIGLTFDVLLSDPVPLSIEAAYIESSPSTMSGR
jgi:hypothetical protein